MTPDTVHPRGLMIGFVIVAGAVFMLMAGRATGQASGASAVKVPTPGQFPLYRAPRGTHALTPN